MAATAEFVQGSEVAGWWLKITLLLLERLQRGNNLGGQRSIDRFETSDTLRTSTVLHIDAASSEAWTHVQ